MTEQPELPELSELPELPDGAPEADALEQATPVLLSDDVAPQPNLGPDTVLPPASEWDALEQSVPVPLDDEHED